MENRPNTPQSTAIVPPENRFAFILVATCFGLWGMINMMTDTLVPAVQKIFSIDTAQSSLIQVVNSASYALLAFPAALMVKRFNYKTGVILGLILLCVGASGIVPAGMSKHFTPLLLAISVLASGEHHGVRYSTGNQSHVIAAHERILRACRQRDGEAAALAMETHVSDLENLVRTRDRRRLADPTSVVARPGRSAA